MLHCFICRKIDFNQRMSSFVRLFIANKKKKINSHGKYQFEKHPEQNVRKELAQNRGEPHQKQAGKDDG